jgi:hypothetical protein
MKVASSMTLEEEKKNLQVSRMLATIVKDIQGLPEINSLRFHGFSHLEQILDKTVIGSTFAGSTLSTSTVQSSTITTPAQNATVSTYVSDNHYNTLREIGFDERLLQKAIFGGSK